jgi:hypothetical protein
MFLVQILAERGMEQRFEDLALGKEICFKKFAITGQSFALFKVILFQNAFFLL